MNILSPNIRNVAIIAHIDHGKTTMLDGLLKQFAFDAGEFQERIMDSYDQERERGITIFAKHCSVQFGDIKINIIDTPGHADFSGEVERVLDMVNAVLLLVDAREGPMPQTRYVLSQALKRGLKVIVVINKIDRLYAEPDEVLSKTFDLFVELSASDEQLNFPYIYASGIGGYAIKDLGDPRVNLVPLLQLVVDDVRPPSGKLENPFLMQIATVFYDDYLGRGACGLVIDGKIKKNDSVICTSSSAEPIAVRLTCIKGYFGIQQVEIQEATVGDIVVLFGIPNILIGDTISLVDNAVALPALKIEEPTISINFMVNSGPFAGKDGKHITMSKIRDRLMKEKRSNATLRIEQIPGVHDSIQVAGRGELHLAVLIESMRREGFEFCVSKPKVITKYIDNILYEVVERVYIEAPEIYSGLIIDALSKRKGEMKCLSVNKHSIAELEFLIPTRGLMGFRHDFLTLTKGKGILTSIFEDFFPYKGEILKSKNGAMISINQGRVTPYAAFSLQERGILYVDSNDSVYEGMIVGQHSKDNDIVVNISREKILTNMRASGKDENIVLVPPKKISLEQAINLIGDDELLEITPNIFRFRKFFLKESDRRRTNRK